MLNSYYKEGKLKQLRRKHFFFFSKSRRLHFKRLIWNKKTVSKSWKQCDWSTLIFKIKENELPG